MISRMGVNMARPALSLTPKVEDFRSIDIAWLRRRGARTAGRSGRVTWSRGDRVIGSIGYRVQLDGLRLQYRCARHGGVPQQVDEVVPIVKTATRFGGVRHWFACPSCGRRCRIMYGGLHFRCRLCRRALYESQYEHPALRICSRRWRLDKNWRNAEVLDGRGD